MTLDEARAFIAKARWVFASTVPAAPHWYTVRRDCAGLGLDAEFVAFQALIEAHGYDRFDARWPWRTWRTLDLEDGFYYWLDGKENLINRARPTEPATEQLSLEGVGR